MTVNSRQQQPLFDPALNCISHVAVSHLAYYLFQLRTRRLTAGRRRSCLITEFQKCTTIASKFAKLVYNLRSFESEFTVRACSNGCNIVGPTTFSNSALCCVNLGYFKVKVLNNNRLPANVKQYAKQALY